MSQQIAAFRRKRTPLADYGIIYFATRGLLTAREGGCALKFSIVQCSIFHWINVATDGRATTTPNQGKALQHPIDPDQPPSPE